MAFDPNSTPIGLRPINVMRHVTDDTRMASMTTSVRPIEGFYANQHRDIAGNANPLPTVYYQSTAPDAGFVPIGFNNGVPAGWVQHVVPSQPQSSIVPAVVNSGGGYTSSPRYDARSASDRASEDNGDDSVSGRVKVKFLCSFGGKILPRPSDGALRYVGGQTRIISVRKDISFSELVLKMTDIYAQDVVIKYQLPDEELDALVSVSCSDDLENMMDEYEKLVERSADGSAKMRIFLFSPSELESSMSIGDLNDGGYRYVEAINGVMDGFGSSAGDNGDRIVRKESMESSTEGGDGSSHVHGEVTSIPSTIEYSPKESSSVVADTAPRMMRVDPSSVPVDPSRAPFGVPVVQTGPATVLGVDQVIDRTIPLTTQQSQPSVTFPVSSQYVQIYQDPRQETFNRANYAQFPPQMGYPGQILGHVGPMLAQQPMPNGAGVSPHQYSQAGHMTMNPSLVSMRPGSAAVPSIVPPQQVHMDHYPAGSMVSQRVVQFGADQGYGMQNAHYHAPVQGGGYNWHHVRHPEQVVLSEGLNCQPILIPERVPLVEDCSMCQKQLPHAHSDSVAQELKESSASALSDSRSMYNSLCLDNCGRPIMAPVVMVAPAERNIEPVKTQTGVEVPELSEVARPSGVMLTSGVPSPYDVYLDNPQPYQANAMQHVQPQPQVQVVQALAVERTLNNDFTPIQTTDRVVRESPKELYGNFVDGSPKYDSSSLAFDHLKQIDGRLENIHLCPSEISAHNEQAEFYEVTEPPPSSNSNLYSSSMLGVNDYVINDNILRTQPIVTGDNNLSPISPSYGAGDVPDNSSSLFSNQDPWNLRNDTHFPPPRPSKLQVRKESTGYREGDSRLMNKSESPTGNGRDPPLGEGLHEQSGNLNRNLSSNKGSAEELVKQELQAVAEGVAASVLHSSGVSNSDLSLYTNNDSAFTPQQNGEFQRANVEAQNKDKFEEVKTKLPDKINLGFPASDGIGRLQIIRNNDLEELRELGSGTFGTVYHGKWRGTDVAIKRINDRCFAAKPSEQERMRDDFWNEAVNLADLHHPNVVAFYGVVLDGPEGSIATVTEYMVNGSLRNALQKNERNLDKRKRLLIGMDVAFGMEYLHGKNIVHFDLKSDNLLVNLRDPHRPICKVGDLGLSKVKCQTLISGGVRGTLPWMAPELLNGSSSLVSEKVDVFSFGIVMWELLTGEEPYADLHYGAIIGGIVSNTLRPPVPQTCDPAWRSLMERCWAAEPSERPNFTEIASELRAMASQSPTKAQA